MARVPNRTPVRKVRGRAVMPSAEELGLTQAANLKIMRRETPMPQVSRAIDAGASLPAKEAAERGMDPATRQALELSRAGDDSLLLPYQPTPSINPPRPRTLAAGYDRDTRTLRIRFRDGTPWEYYDVPPQVWRNFTRVKSPGRFVNRTLNNYPYARGNF